MLFDEIVNILSVQLGELLQLQNIQPLLADLDAGHIRLRALQLFSDIYLSQTCFKPSFPQFSDKIAIFLCSYCVYHNIISVYAGLQYLNSAYYDKLNLEAAKQNQKFPFHFLSAPPTPPAEEKKKGKENFWVLLPRPKGADEARRIRAYDLVQSFHALRACEIGSRKVNNNSTKKAGSLPASSLRKPRPRLLPRRGLGKKLSFYSSPFLINLCSMICIRASEKVFSTRKKDRTQMKNKPKMIVRCIGIILA